MSDISDNSGQKKNNVVPYISWPLSFTVFSAEGAWICWRVILITFLEPWSEQ
ncbi:Uncharacterised protein [Escherichia coli]|nr:Uncharacterised protein [Escherichia coli]SVF39378.1 Uncharacterised protein [Escherichia coli]